MIPASSWNHPSHSGFHKPALPTHVLFKFLTPRTPKHNKQYVMILTSIIILFYATKFGGVVLPAVDNRDNHFKSRWYLGQARLGTWSQQRVTPL